jgi:putative phage-type endonuclease
MSIPKEVIIDKALIYYGWIDDIDVSRTVDEYKDISELVTGLGDNPVTSSDIKERIEKIRDYQIRLEKLKLIPRIEQRSPEWYAIRQTLITASDMGQALGIGKFGTAKDLIIKKCGYKELPPFNATLPPLKWGVMFEPVAADIYRNRNGKIELFEFGLIPHPTVSYLGASPDGATATGILLEIKCPYMRKITGEIPDQYYYQIQAQLDTCDLDECDYIELKFSKYELYKDYKDDTDIETGTLSQNRMEKGIIIEIRDEDPPRYIYSPICMTLSQSDEWVENNTANLPRNKYYLNFYHLEKYMCKRIFRDPDFMAQKLVELGMFWSRIEAYKTDFALYQKEIESLNAPDGSTKRGTNGSKRKEPSKIISIPAFSTSSSSTTSSSVSVTARGPGITGFAFTNDSDDDMI